MASGMNNISSELRRSELTDRELGTAAYADTNELIINSELEFDDRTEYRQSALQFEDHKARKGFAQKPSEGLKIIVGTSMMFAVGVTVALIISIYLGPPMANSHGAVVSDSDECSEMGLSILQSGGSAVDAAITTVFCEGVVRPHVTGIGGGGCLIIRKHAEKLTQVVNFREMIPATFAASTQVGGQVAVPGLVKGLMEAHKLAGGRLSWDMLLKPVIKLAREGFSVSQDLADSIKQLNTSGVKVTDRLLKMVHNSSSQPFTEGQVMTRPELARLLENIVANGSMPLYDVRGQVGQDVVTTVTEEGGKMTMADMTAFVAPTVSALKTTFYNLTVEVPAVSPGGALLLLALNIVQSLGFHPKSAAENVTYHYIAESLIAALAQQYKWADMDSMVSSNNITSELTSDQFAQKLRALISANTSQSFSHYGGQNYTINTDATVSHVSVFGSNEDMVSVSTSLGSPFGSGLVTDSGVILNNQLALFDVVGSMKERRVPSLTVPVVVHTPGRPCGARFTLCSSPGHQVIASMVQILTSVAAFNQGLNESISQPRLYPLADTLQYDADFKQDIVTFLQNIGHVTEAAPNGFSTVDGVAKINETVSSVTDKYGISVGVSF